MMCVPRNRRRLPALLLAGCAAIALAACTPAEGDDDDDDSGSPSWASQGVDFDYSQAQQIAGSSEFLFVDVFCTYYGCAGSGPAGGSNQSNPYLLHGVHLALSAGLTGAGQLVAQVDDGIRTSHQEFAGKTIYTWGAVSAEDHGTHVASLILGRRDGVGMHGVAPGADLHFTAYSSLNNITNGTMDAALLGAVAQNNSWGYDVSSQDILNYLNNNGGSLANAMSQVIGAGTASDWQAYIDALNFFQQTGVIVFAITNDTGDIYADAMAALPVFDTSLSEAWLTAINGYFEVDNNGNIVDAVRISGACGYTAAFCLAGDGTTEGARAGSNSSYDVGTGTSFVAPQISGAIALMAQAFPDLSPAEWADRLLATADNSWFNSEGVSIDGVVDFGDGITHGYSFEWGHGVIDLEAAFSPIGTVSVLAGENVADATRLPLIESSVISGGTYGDALSTALAGREMAVFDSFNGNFRMDAGALAYNATPAVSAGLMQSVSPRLNADLSPVTNAISVGAGGMFRFANDVADVALGGNPELGAISAQSLAHNAAVLSTTRQWGNLGVEFYGYAGGHDAGGDASMAGVGANLSVATPITTFSLGVGQSLERGAILGLVGNDVFDFGDGSLISSANLGFNTPIGDSMALFGNLELGVANATGFDGGGLVSSISSIGYRGFQLGASFDDVLADGDRITLSYVQPMRIENGSVSIALPVSRMADGTIINETRSADLTPSGQQRDLALDYDIQLNPGSQLRFRVQYSFDSGNVAGENGFALAAGYRRAF